MVNYITETLQLYYTVLKAKPARSICLRGGGERGVRRLLDDDELLVRVALHDVVRLALLQDDDVSIPQAPIGPSTAGTLRLAAHARHARLHLRPQKEAPQPAGQHCISCC